MPPECPGQESIGITTRRGVGRLTSLTPSAVNMPSGSIGRMWGGFGAAVYDLVQAGPDRGELGRRRRALLSPSSGRVVEIGVGTGRALGAYPPGTRVVGVEPDRAMLRRAVPRAAAASATVALVQATGDRLPLPEESVDEVVLSMVLCTVPYPGAVLAEAARVLVAGGVLRFYEHVQDPDPGIAARQRRLRPLWSVVGGGCQLDRDALAAISRAGFLLGEHERRNFPGAPAFIRSHVSGWALKPAG